MKRSTTALFLLLTAAFPSPALAAGDASTVASGAPDRGFLSEAARDGEAEVELGRMAAERASSPEVKQFAERMVRDHEAANQKLMALAREPKVKAPPPPGEEAQARMRELQGASGVAFDRAYMRYMIEDHAKAIALFQREAEDGEDAATRELADALLLTLQEHLRMARQIGGRVGVRG